MFFCRILLSAGKIYVKRRTIPRDSLPLSTTGSCLMGGVPCGYLRRCSAFDAITLLPGHEKSSFSFVIHRAGKTMRCIFSRSYRRGKSDGKLSWSRSFIELLHTRGTLRKSEQSREITASRKLTMLFANFFFSNRCRGVRDNFYCHRD